MIAVADTGPLLHLSLIDRIELLPQIFDKVLIPQAVADELSQPSTPEPASALIERSPFWLEICTVPSVDASLSRFGSGEREAITLALSAGADVLLMDDRAASTFATQVMYIAVSGTIGVLYEAAIEDLIPFTATSFDESTDRLLAGTNFRSTGLEENYKGTQSQIAYFAQSVGTRSMKPKRPAMSGSN